MLKPFCKNLRTGEVRQVFSIVFNEDGTVHYIATREDEYEKLELWFTQDYVDSELVDIPLEIKYAGTLEGAVQLWEDPKVH